MSFNWKGCRVAVLGGDRREVEIVRSLVAAGASVRTCGLMAGGAEASGNPAATTVAAAVAPAVAEGASGSPSSRRRSPCTRTPVWSPASAPSARTWPASSWASAPE